MSCVFRLSQFWIAPEDLAIEAPYVHLHSQGRLVGPGSQSWKECFTTHEGHMMPRHNHRHTVVNISSGFRAPLVGISTFLWLRESSSFLNLSWILWDITGLSGRLVVNISSGFRGPRVGVSTSLWLQESFFNFSWILWDITGLSGRPDHEGMISPPINLIISNTMGRRSFNTFMRRQFQRVLILLNVGFWFFIIMRKRSPNASYSTVPREAVPQRREDLSF